MTWRRVVNISLFLIFFIGITAFGYSTINTKSIEVIVSKRDNRLSEYNVAKSIAIKGVNILKLPYEGSSDEVKNELYNILSSDTRELYFSKDVELLKDKAPNISVISTLGDIRSDNSFTFRVEILFGNEDKLLYLIDIQNRKILNIERI